MKFKVCTIAVINETDFTAFSNGEVKSIQIKHYLSIIGVLKFGQIANMIDFSTKLIGAEIF